MDPRVGIAVQIPKLNWVFRAFWGRYYQAPPLLTATGPLLDLANSNNVAFAPLLGERDNEYQFGVTIPYRGWALDADHFQTTAQNWLDHSNIGESNLFWPITWADALIQTWELTLRSPRLWRFGQFHLAYCKSNRTSERTHHRGFNLPASREFNDVSALCAAGLVAGGSRPTQHLERGIQRNASVAVVCFGECVLRLWVHQRRPGTGNAVSQQLLARAHQC